MEATLVNNFSISPLAKIHNRASFCCGVDSLDDYLQLRAGQDNRRLIAVPYILFDETAKKVAGFYTLSATTIELVDLPETIRKKMPNYPYLPATLIGRLAIDNSYKKRGLGEIILFDALRRAYLASQTIASFAVIVDVINRNAEKFYKKYGFLDLSKKANKLFIAMSTLEELMDLKDLKGIMAAANITNYRDRRDRV